MEKFHNLFKCVDGSDNFAFVWTTVVTVWNGSLSHHPQNVEVYRMLYDSFNLFSCSSSWLRSRPLTSLSSLRPPLSSFVMINGGEIVAFCGSLCFSHQHRGEIIFFWYLPPSYSFVQQGCGIRFGGWPISPLLFWSTLALKAISKSTVDRHMVDKIQIACSRGWIGENLVYKIFTVVVMVTKITVGIFRAHLGIEITHHDHNVASGSLS